MSTLSLVEQESMALSRLGNLQLKKTVFFLCDMQEKFRPAITYFRDIVEVAKRMVCFTLFFTFCE